MAILAFKKAKGNGEVAKVAWCKLTNTRDGYVNGVSFAEWKLLREAGLLPRTPQ